MRLLTAQGDSYDCIVVEQPDASNDAEWDVESTREATRRAREAAEKYAATAHEVQPA